MDTTRSVPRLGTNVGFASDDGGLIACCAEWDSGRRPQTRCSLAARDFFVRAPEGSKAPRKNIEAADVDLPLRRLSRREKRYVSIEEEKRKTWTERRDGTDLALSIGPGLKGSNAEGAAGPRA
jgi:hypothetical protein